MPRWAIASDFIPARLMRLSNRISPLDGRTIPIIDFSSVVFPAPLRPRTATISPAAISSATSRSTVIDPYPELKFRTERSGKVTAVVSSRMRMATATEIGVDNSTASHEFVEGSGSEDDALMQHEHRRGERANERHVMLHDDERMMLC